jgi:hypothetical protein
LPSPPLIAPCHGQASRFPPENGHAMSRSRTLCTRFSSIPLLCNEVGQLLHYLTTDSRKCEAGMHSRCSPSRERGTIHLFITRSNKPFGSCFRT